MSYVLRLKELMPLLDDIIALDREIARGKKVKLRGAQQSS
jgi:hypothetical protein